MRGVLPLTCLLLWGWFALSGSAGEFSSAVQTRYYLWLPLAMAGLALALLLLRDAKYMNVAAQVLAALMLFSLLPYLFFYTGGM